MAKKNKQQKGWTTYSKGASATSTGYSASTAASTLIQTTPRPVMRIGEAIIYGGTSDLMGTVPNLRFILDLSDCPDDDLPEHIVWGNDVAGEVLPEELFVSPIPILHLNWQDGKAGGVDEHWWYALIRWIEELPAPAAVGVGCMGGHGRTGTALAVLASLSGQSGEDDPVGFVRDHYSKDAVETEDQIQYIERITGIRVQEWASDDLLRYSYMLDGKGAYPEAPDINSAAFDAYGERSETAGPTVLGPPGMQDSHE